MREIKFRLRIGNEIVGYEKWNVGTGDNAGWLYCKNPNGKYPDNVWRPDYIYHTGKDQFTGLPDKNVKEIYEGDVVKYHDDFYSDPADIGGRKHIVRDRLYVIWWHPLKAAFWLKSIPGAITESLWSLDCKIIGNIHENPELLKGA